jgi:formylglycine-generating enzyme required for sulfatase activity
VGEGLEHVIRASDRGVGVVEIETATSAHVRGSVHVCFATEAGGGEPPSRAEGASHTERPVIRGASWLDHEPRLFRSAMRGLAYPEHGLTHIGFRCVRRGG